MCTATWLHQPDGYHLFHSRDELRTRLPALPPRLHVRAGVRLIAPVDADAGGTWIGVNEFKLAACLLNRYDPVDPTRVAGPLISRGHLIMHALEATDLNEACKRVAALPLTRYQPFTLALLYPNTPACLLEWNGIALNHVADADQRLPLVSSAHDQLGASRVRNAAYATVVESISPQTLTAFHASHSVNGPDGLSVCMSHADACTVSFTHITVSRDKISLTYHPAPLCEPVDNIVIDLDPAS